MKNGSIFRIIFFLSGTVFFGCTVEDYLHKDFPPKKTCPDFPMVEYEGETYSTVLIGDQCWMAKNLNVGKRIDSDIESTANDTIEKYCHFNLEQYCNYYGGLYQWDELMQYSADGSGQGICPTGWRIPLIEDYAQLFNYVEGLAYPLIKPNSCWFGSDPFDLSDDTCLRDIDNGQTGFDLLPAGRIEYGETYHGYNTQLWMNSQSHFWLTVDYYRGYIYFEAMNEKDLLNRYLSIRCIKENDNKNE
jgi:uncharacterized protein (TIGR02145 family)